MALKQQQELKQIQRLSPLANAGDKVSGVELH